LWVSSEGANNEAETLYGVSLWCERPRSDEASHLCSMKGTNNMANTSTVIRNVNFYYAKLDKPVSPFGTEIYDMQIRFPKERIEEMSVYGKVREVEDGNFAINLTRKAMNSKKQKTPVRVVDTDKNPIKDLIGNGSSGNVIVYSYDWEVSGRTGRKSVLIAVQVTNLIKYVPESTVDFDVLEPIANQEPVSADF
jgi:hypothetical protein